MKSHFSILKYFHIHKIFKLTTILSFVFLILNTTAQSQITEDEKNLISPSRSFSTDLDYSIDLNLLATLSNGEELPFWMFHNRRGRISENSNLSTWVSGKHVIFFTPESYLISGAGILYTDGKEGGIAMDELFIHFQNNLLFATAGRKQQRELFNGLSASNRSILWSLNARPMWGLQFGTSKPYFLTGEEGLGFEASWNEYWMGKDRYVEDALVHHKTFHFVYRKGTWEVKAGLQHFVQWAGESPEGEQPDGWENYWRIITRQQGAADADVGDQLNALGNHLGGYELSVVKEFQGFSLLLFYNHLFEDGSGMMLRNTPDGRYAVFLEKRDKSSWVNSVIYELYYTQHQSYTFPNTDGRDNYFNSGTYRSGWTHNNMVLGAPFFTVDPDEEGIINNKFTAHHIGIGGEIGNMVKSYPYKLLVSYARNDGLYSKRFRPKQNVFYLLTDLTILQNDLELHVQFGADWNSYTSPVYGVGLEMKYKL